LPPWARKILDCFALAYLEGQPNGRIQVPQKLVLEWANSGSKSTIETAIKQTMLLRFIEATGTRTVRLTFLPAGDCDPTDEWAQIKTIAEGEAILGGKKRRPQTSDFKHATAAGDMSLLRNKPKVVPLVS
jgi:hypothetical protein